MEPLRLILHMPAFSALAGSKDIPNLANFVKKSLLSIVGGFDKCYKVFNGKDQNKNKLLAHSKDVNTSLTSDLA